MSNLTDYHMNPLPKASDEVNVFVIIVFIVIFIMCLIGSYIYYKYWKW